MGSEGQSDCGQRNFLKRSGLALAGAPIDPIQHFVEIARAADLGLMLRLWDHPLWT